MTALRSLVGPNVMPLASEDTIMISRLMPYTRLRPILSPSQPKVSCPSSVPTSASALTAALASMGSLPGLAPGTTSW